MATRSGCVKATQDNHTPTALFIASCRCLQQNHRFHVPRKMRTLRTHCSRYGWARSRPIAPSSTSCWACGVLQQNSRGASLLFASFKLLRLSCSPAVFLSAEPLTSCPARPIGSSQQDDDWPLATTREALIRPLGEATVVTIREADEVAQRLGISRSLVYELVFRFRRTQQTSSLLPHKRGLKPHAVLLSPVIDDLITKAIN